ncbi:WhiB family transcriptional regulator [Streptomyces sp. NPDC020196]|uniref:WhiB family transcriptional regulator n=1 Tax=Streptomyces sp. NPDC020196 TaxID=3156656 RepID=UPI0033E3538B
MTTQTLPKRLSTTIAVSSRETSHWESEATCREVDGDSFFTESKAGIERARAVCMQCPVLVECLRDRQAKDDKSYQWGVGGGLSAVQRRVLAVEALLGNRPNLVMARLLVSPQWSYRLRNLSSARWSLGGVVQGLREDGLMVDLVTVRVAVWWLGGEGSRLARGRHWRHQLRDHLDLIVALREKGARFLDIAVFFGVPEVNGAKAVSELLLAVAAEKEMAA